MAGYYRKFYDNFFDVAESLINFLSKRTKDVDTKYSEFEITLIHTFSYFFCFSLTHKSLSVFAAFFCISYKQSKTPH